MQKYDVDAQDKYEIVQLFQTRSFPLLDQNFRAYASLPVGSYSEKDNYPASGSCLEKIPEVCFARLLPMRKFCLETRRSALLAKFAKTEEGILTLAKMTRISLRARLYARRNFVSTEITTSRFAPFARMSRCYKGS